MNFRHDEVIAPSMSGTRPLEEPNGKVDLRVLHGPMNFANQPMLLVKELRKLGVEANHLQYSSTGKHPFGYELDQVYDYRPSRRDGQARALIESMERRYNVYHFWQRSLLFSGDLRRYSGLDLPFIKTSGAKIVHRSTGFDVRTPKEDMAANPYSPFRYGYEYPFDEAAQRQYLQIVRDYADVMVVQDPELAQFVPGAKIIPRGLELSEWDYVGVKKTDCPLVVHAPSNASCKGSKFIIDALEALQAEGLRFEYKLLNRVSHEEARSWYRKADIIIDQILIGATGVLTLEAWALGKPCVTYLREDLFEPFYGPDLPVANANPDTLKPVMRKLIQDFEWRTHLAARGRETAEKHHDIRNVARQCLAMYQSLEVEPVKEGGLASVASFVNLMTGGSGGAETLRGGGRKSSFMPEGWRLFRELRRLYRLLPLRVRRPLSPVVSAVVVFLMNRPSLRSLLPVGAGALGGAVIVSAVFLLS